MGKDKGDPILTEDDIEDIQATLEGQGVVIIIPED